ncbi:MAG: hypothetical protein J7L04_07820 [Bacteroidales bacterium]|nr:hypothetical protein [Bacteroidales bacterium]
MKTIKFFGIPALLTVLLLMATIPFQSCEPIEVEDDPNDTIPHVVALKPNIYIYPTVSMELSLNINFPLGGEIITSIPEYGTGWDVFVDTNGLIDNKYNYLFYESSQPDVWQQDDGWIVKKTDLADFFYKNLADYGFFGQEIQDYIDYWIPRLTDFEFYAIYPQNSIIIEKVIEFYFSENPDNLLRLFYLIKGLNDMPDIKPVEPNIKTFERKDFFVVEWGVVLK